MYYNLEERNIVLEKCIKCKKCYCMAGELCTDCYLKSIKEFEELSKNSKPIMIRMVE